MSQQLRELAVMLAPALLESRAAWAEAGGGICPTRSWSRTADVSRTPLELTEDRLRCSSSDIGQSFQDTS